MFASYSTQRVEAEITELAAQIAADTCRWLLLVAEFDRREAYLDRGFHCCAVWLAWRCSIVPRAAREQVRVARRLTELPLVRESFARGELSYSKVRAITKVDDPELESDLLEMARCATAAQLERLVQALRGALSVDSARDALELRHFGYSWEDDGSLSVRGRLSPDEGALFLRALEAGRDMANDQPATASPDDGSAKPLANRRASNADAVVTMAESLLACGAASRGAGERHEVVVHVDATTLGGNGASRGGTPVRESAPDRDGPKDRRDEARGAGARCEVENGPAICAETARRLACDGSVVGMLEGPDGTLHVGRRTRAIPPAIRRALRSRDRGCRFPGCPNHRWVDGHHIRHWAAGGETTLDNLVQLCRRHHRLVHEDGYSIERERDGRLVFRRPDGSPIPNSPSLARVEDEHRTRPVGLGTGTRPVGLGTGGSRRRRPQAAPVAGPIPLPLSAGEPMDLDLAVGALAARARPEGPDGPLARAGPAP